MLPYQRPQITSLYGLPPRRRYMQPPIYQYNTAYKNTAHIARAKQPQTGLPGSQYSKIFKAQPQRQYVSYYYPHRTHYRDWSRKLLEASAFARKLQESRKQTLLRQKQRTDPSGAGIKFFVAGVNPNGKVLQQLATQGKVQNANGNIVSNKPLKQNFAENIPNTQLSGATRPIQLSPSPATVTNMNNKPQRGPAFVVSHPEIPASPPLQDQNAKTKTSSNEMSPRPLSVGMTVGNDKNANLQSQPRLIPSFNKGSSTNSNGAILSDKFEGAALGPKAHSLLQPTPALRSSQSGNLPHFHADENKKPNMSHISLGSGISLNNGSPANDYTLTQEEQRNAPTGKDQNQLINKGSGNLLGNSPSITQDNSHPLLQTSISDKPAQGGSQASLTTQEMKNVQASASPALNSANVDKSTAQELKAGLVFASPSRTPSQALVTQPSRPRIAPNGKNSFSRNDLPGGFIHDPQTQLDKELALKNLLFPPPAVSKNQAFGTNPVVPSNSAQFQQPQQGPRAQVDNMIPTFPAFRYDRRHNIPQSPSRIDKKSFVPQNNKVPYKGSFPLMLHKFSPYFKMKRNLKQVASEQAKARRRFLELQRKLRKIM